MVLAGRGSCGPGFVRDARESVGVSESGRSLLARTAPWLRGRASAAGSGGLLPGLSDLELPGRLLSAGVGWVGAASRQAVHPDQAVFILNVLPASGAAAVGVFHAAAHRSCCGRYATFSRKNAAGPPPPSVLFGLARPPVTSAETRTVARLQFLPWCRQYGRLSLGAREGN